MYTPRLLTCRNLQQPKKKALHDLISDTVFESRQNYYLAEVTNDFRNKTLKPINHADKISW